jgi:hypothetical protein
MLVFSYIFLWSRNATIWPAPPEFMGFFVAAALCGVGGGSGFAAARLYARTPNGAVAAVIVGACAIAAAWTLSFTDWRAHGLEPELSSHDALIATFLSWDIVFVVVVALMALYALARRIAGLLAPERPMTIQCISLFMIYAAAQALIALFITRIFPLAV